MSNLVAHARSELKPLLEHDDPMERDVARSVLAAIEGFASYDGHSGGSAMVAIHWLTELLRFRSIRPLTNDPAEWLHVGDDLWQSRRNAEAFSENGGQTYYVLSEDRRDDNGDLVRDRHAHTAVAASGA